MKNKKCITYSLKAIINNPNLLLGKFDCYYYNHSSLLYSICYFYKIDKKYIYVFMKNTSKEPKENYFLFGKVYMNELKIWFNNCENIELF